MDLMKKEESYAERRQLFKNIWETAMQINEKDADIMNKPKVIKKHSCSKFPPESLFLHLLWINPAFGKSLSEGTVASFTDKTLRLDEVDRCVIGKRKKERIRNLRTVCNKILDFCDRQDADDMYYQQIAEGKEHNIHYNIDLKPKKQKTHRGKKKIKKAKSLSVDNAGDQANATTSDGNDDYPEYTKACTNPSPIKMKRVVVRKTLVRNKTSKVKSNPDNTEANNEPCKVSVTRRRIVRKKRSKRKKSSVSNVSPPSGTLDWPDP